ncbi:MAG: glycoside hydrolase family 3 C-terminal domain-containing protein [Candidatus Goldiibacteriota bacterium]
MKSLEKPDYLNTKLPLDRRCDDLVSRMTHSEKLSQLIHESPAIPRLGIKKYNWWNECLHGVARAGIATVFPQAIGLAACFDRNIMKKTGRIISDEARAKYHANLDEKGSKQYFGLTFWTPNINIFRDPRWGRGQETYGECPYLTSELAVSFIKAMQGSGKYLKTAACAKHFAAHSGPENLRHGFDAKVSQKDLWETYLPAFEACVKKAKVRGVMTAYNRVNGEPASAGKTLLVDILRDKWRFKGYVVSDCGAIDDIYLHHKSAGTFEEAMSKAVIAGCDLNCCNDICSAIRPKILKMSAKAAVAEEIIDRNLKRLLRIRFELGMFDPDSNVKHSKISRNAVDCAAHKKAALEAARGSLVLLKNSGVLPLKKKEIRRLAVIGPNADELSVLLGNYSGTPSEPVTVLEGFKNMGVECVYEKGCGINKTIKNGFARAAAAALESDAAVVCTGLSPEVEGEECDTGGFERGSLNLLQVQEELIKRIRGTGRPVIVLNFSGGAVSIKPETADAVIQAWYPGQSGGTAAAELIFGRFSPSGRLPVTVYESEKDLPAFEDYSMKNRTYRYFKGKALYPFGYGLSYTRFEYSGFSASKTKEGGVKAAVYVKNAGMMKSSETVMLFMRLPGGPEIQLAGFEKTMLKPGEKKRAEFRINRDELFIINSRGEKTSVKGKIKMWAGGILPGYENRTKGFTQCRGGELWV